MNHPRFAISTLWLFAVLIVLSGCAGAPAVELPEGTDVIFSYTPASEAETALVADIETADAKARLDVDVAEKELNAAVAAYQAAARSLKDAKDAAAAGLAAPEGRIATEEEIQTLLDKAKAKNMVLELTRIGMIDRYEAFLTDYPENWYVRHRYAWFLADQLMRYESAEEWERVTKQEPRFPFAYNNLGTLYNHMGRDKESIVLFRKAISLYDDDPTFHTNLAVNYSTHRAEAGELYGWDLPRIFEECIAEYRKALALTPEDRQIAYDLASQYVMAKYFKVTDTADRAIADWKYYLTLDLSDNQRGVGYRNVGRIYLTQKKDYAEAITWLEKAHEILKDPSSEVLLERARKEAASSPAPEE